MNDPKNEEMIATSPLDGGSAGYVDELYEDYLADPRSVSEDWRNVFSGLPKVNGFDSNTQDVSHAAIRDYFYQLGTTTRARAAVPSSMAHEHKQEAVIHLVQAYRRSGHMRANLDPLGLQEPREIPELDFHYHGLTEADLETEFSAGSFAGIDKAPLKEIIAALNATYSGNIGIESDFIRNIEEREWVQAQFERHRSQPRFSKEEQEVILDKLVAAEGIERFLNNKYVGQKRFSLEGGESLIPLLNEMIETSGALGVREVIMGMAHRGRINVLVNVLGKLPTELFDEFEGKHIHNPRSGDVKYHLGFSSDIETKTGNTHLVLAFNPSHLEIVSPVVEGSVRARQDRRRTAEKVLPVAIHGDSAFIGQGVVMETFTLSQTRGFGTQGTIHIVINNQVGFTTSNHLDTRSTHYCTDVAKMILAPVFHVNGDDPDAVALVARVATEYRQKFGKDVVIDLVCYRKQGHNEADDPTITQPLMYQAIRKHKSPTNLYADKLIAEGVIDKATYDAKVNHYRDSLDAGKPVTRAVPSVIGKKSDEFSVDWTPYLDGSLDEPVDTTISEENIAKYVKTITATPDGFKLSKIVAKEIANRVAMGNRSHEMNWGFAETLAYASLVDEGFAVRLVGQDVGRGTFAHRHAIMYDQQTRQDWIPLQEISETQGKFHIYDSVLSEEAVLAFEYGYATTMPNTFVIWEAQFGDFANGAQVVIDQFISSGEQKWGRACGLTMLLPHGYEGMGPEHSSARLERYLQLCAQQNMVVCMPTTPAQIFHLLRRQMKQKLRKPLIVMSPKSLLRHKQAVSPLTDLHEGHFHRVIPEIDESLKASAVERVVVCSGKVYYDLLNKRDAQAMKNVVIVRVEQLYPFPEEELTAQLAKYKKAKTVVWCQEEPQNQGAWYCTRHRLQACLGKGQELVFAGRADSASPAAGYAAVHQQQQIKLVDEALGLA